MSTNCQSGPTEILESGLYGRLVPVGVHNALAKAIIQTQDNPISLDILIRRSEDFAPIKPAERYLEILFSK